MKSIRLLAAQIIASPRVLWLVTALALLALALAAGAPEGGSCGTMGC